MYVKKGGEWDRMNVDLFSQIKTNYNAFSNAEKKVADYILSNTEDVIYMSITDLADVCDVGESSVFRFCKSIGLKGYQELKIKMAYSSSQEESVENTVELSMDDSTKVVTQKLLATTTQALKDTSNLINEKNIQKTIELFHDAERIYFFGVGSSLITALDANSKFMRITNKTTAVMDAHLQAMTASLMTKDDVAVMFSYSGQTIDTIENARVAHERGAKVVAITRFTKSPLTNYADITLLTGANEGPLQGGSLSAKISQLFLLDLLYTEYFKLTKEASANHKQVTSKAVAGKLL